MGPKTIEQIKGMNAAKGFHFFEPDTLRFFRSKVYGEVYAGGGGWFFVTSEQFVCYEPRYCREPRAYSVRYMRPDGQVETVGEFNSIPTLQRARTLARQAAADNLKWHKTLP